MPEFMLWKIIMLSLFISPAISFFIISEDTPTAVSLYFLNVIITFIVGLILSLVILGVIML